MLLEACFDTAILNAVYPKKNLQYKLFGGFNSPQGAIYAYFICSSVTPPGEKSFKKK